MRVLAERSVVACVAVLAFAVPATAASLYIEAGSSAGNSGYTASANSGPLSYSGSSSSGFGSTGVYSTLVDYGVHRASASVQSAAYSDTANGASQWLDELRITSATAGHLIIGIDLTAVLTSDPAALRDPTSSRASFQYQMSALSSLGSSSYGHNQSNVTGGYGGHSYVGTHLTDTVTVRDSGALFSRFVTLSIAFAAGGDTIYLHSRANCHAQAIGDGVGETASANCNAGNSVYWGGILGVVDNAGAAITGYTLASSSRTDYAKSFVPQGGIPEPSSWALIILGMALGGGALRRVRGHAAA